MKYSKLSKIKIGDLVLFEEEFDSSKNLCVGFIRQISEKKFTLNFNRLKEHTFLSKLFMEREIYYRWIKFYKILKIADKIGRKSK